MAARNKVSVYLSDGEFRMVEEIQSVLDGANPEKDPTNLSSVVRAGVRLYHSKVMSDKKAGEP